MHASKLISALCLGLGLQACQVFQPQAPDPATSALATVVPSDAELQAAYQALASAGGTVYVMDAAASKLLLYVYRGGLAAKAGHNHVISAQRFLAYVHLPSKDATRARFDLTLPLNDLVVDDPALRQETGANFAGERSESDITGTRRNMLGPRGLQADQYPAVHLKSVAITGDWPVLVADIAVTLHGVTRQQLVVLHVRHDATELTVTGSLVLRQTDFGIEPFSLFGGVLSVQDAVAIDFALSGQPARF